MRFPVLSILRPKYAAKNTAYILRDTKKTGGEDPPELVEKVAPLRGRKTDLRYLNSLSTRALPI